MHWICSFVISTLMILLQYSSLFYVISIPFITEQWIPPTSHAAKIKYVNKQWLILSVNKIEKQKCKIYLPGGQIISYQLIDFYPWVIRFHSGASLVHPPSLKFCSVALRILDPAGQLFATTSLALLGWSEVKWETALARHTSHMLMTDN